MGFYVNSGDFSRPTNGAQAAANLPADRRYVHTPRAGHTTSPPLQETRYDPLRHDACNTQNVPRPQGHIAEGQPFNDSYNHKRILPPVRIVMVQTHLRNGRISNQPEDVEYWKPGFVVPDEMARNLLRRHSTKAKAYLLILKHVKGNLIAQVNGKEKDWQQILKLALDESIVLQTRIKNGIISLEPEDVVLREKNFQIPSEVFNRLKQDFWATPNAELFILSDSKENLRSIVKDKKTSVCRYINKRVGKAII